LKLEGDLDILKMYLYTENEVARLRHSKLLIMDEICTANEKNTSSPTSNNFIPSYINFWPVVFEMLCRQTHRHHRKQYLLAACAQVKKTKVILVKNKHAKHTQLEPTGLT